MKNESNESEKTYPLTAYQKDIWLQHCLYPGETLHTIGGYLIMEGDLCVPCFMQAIREVTIHEEAIRITIGRKEQVPFQKFSVLEDVPIEYIDYAGAEDGLDRCLEAMENSFQIPFDLYGHSLFEYKLFKVNGQQYYCFVKFHHIIMDGELLSFSAVWQIPITESWKKGKTLKEKILISHLSGSIWNIWSPRNTKTMPVFGKRNYPYCRKTVYLNKMVRREQVVTAENRI